ncbi:hypothetical protein HDV00_008272 [Rhizophlyctis rosea]|nr:hypothetical protein HDV00_008272 [Rhizophlyctis rosea]
MAKEFQSFAETGSPSLLLIFIMRIFIDVNTILGNDVERGYSDLKLQSLRYLVAWKQWQEVGPPSDRTSLHRDYSLMENFELIVSRFIIGKDEIGRLKQGHYDLTTYPKPHNLPNIINAAHLYHTLKTAGCIGEGGWKDMEWVLGVQGRERVFRGKLPTNFREANNTLMLLYGLDVASFVPLDKRRKDKQGNYVMDRFKKRHWVPDVKFEFGLPVTGAFRKRVWVTDLTGKQQNGEAHWGRMRAVLDAIALAFLKTLQQALQIERPYISFNYLSLHTRCIRLCAPIYQIIQPEIQKYPCSDLGGALSAYNLKGRDKTHVPPAHMYVVLLALLVGEAECVRRLEGKERRRAVENDDVEFRDTVTMSRVADAIREVIGGGDTEVVALAQLVGKGVGVKTRKEQ